MHVHAPAQHAYVCMRPPAKHVLHSPAQHAHVVAQRARFVSRILPAETTCQLSAPALRAAAEALAQRLHPRLLAAAKEAGLGSGSQCQPLPFAIAYKARTAERQSAAAAPPNLASGGTPDTATLAIATPESAADTSTAAGLSNGDNSGRQTDRAAAQRDRQGRGAEPDLAARGVVVERPPALPSAQAPEAEADVAADIAAGNSTGSQAGCGAEEAVGCWPQFGADRKPYGNGVAASAPSQPSSLHEPERIPDPDPKPVQTPTEHAAEVGGGGGGSVGVCGSSVGAPEQAPDRGAVLAALAAGFAAGTLGEPKLRVDLKAPWVRPNVLPKNPTCSSTTGAHTYGIATLLAGPQRGLMQYEAHKVHHAYTHPIVCTIVCLHAPGLCTLRGRLRALLEARAEILTQSRDPSLARGKSRDPMQPVASRMQVVLVAEALPLGSSGLLCALGLLSAASVVTKPRLQARPVGKGGG